MTFHVPTLSKAGLAAREAEAKASFAFEEDERIASERAVIGKSGSTWAGPEVVNPGSEALSEGEFSQTMHAFDHDKIRKRQIREAKARGNLRPAQIVEHGDGAMPTNVWRDEHDTESVTAGVFCWRCGDSRSDSAVEQKRRHKKLAQHQPHYKIPSGMSEMDCCGTCGAVLKVGAA